MHTATIKTSMGDIADSGATPIRKQHISSIPMDAKMQGNNVANAVIARVMTEAVTWKQYALQLIALPVEGRTQFITAIDAWLKDCKARNADSMGTVDREGKANPTKDDKRLAIQRVNSATVEVSKLRTVANGFNSGADTEGLVAYFKTTQRLPGKVPVSVEEIGYAVIVEYARTFNASKAGRKADPFLVKLAKWLEKNPAAEDDVKGAKAWAAVAELIATMG